MKLKDARDNYYFHSGKTSDLVRQLGLAAIAVIWLFKVDAAGNPRIPPELLFPLALVIVALAADFAQYAIATAVWGIFQRRKELAEVGEDTDFVVPRQFNWPAISLFVVKAVCVALAYVYIFRYVYARIA